MALKWYGKKVVTDFTGMMMADMQPYLTMEATILEDL